MALTQVTSAGLKDGEIVNADLHSAAAIAVSKLSGVMPLAGGTFTGNVKWNDGIKALFGTGSDLQVWHDDTAGYIHSDKGKIRLQVPASNHILLEGDDGTYMGIFKKGSSVELYYDNSKKLETFTNGIDVSGQVRVTASSTGYGSNFYDNIKSAWGDSQDLQIYHSGSNSFIVGGTGNIRVQQKLGEDGIVAIPDGAVELYYDNSKKLETTSGGVAIDGDLKLANQSIDNAVNWGRVSGVLQARDSTKITFGNANDLEIYHDGSNNFIVGTSNTWIKNSGQQGFAAGSEYQVRCTANGSVELFYDNSKKLETSSDGATVTGVLTVLNTEGLSASLYLTADDGDDNGDSWRLNSNQDDNDLTFANNTSGSYVDKLTLQNDGDLYTTGDVYTTSGKHIIVNSDSGKIKLGGSQDLEIYHDGTDSYITNATGNTLIQGNTGGNLYLQAHSGDGSIVCNANGSVDLYYDGNKKFETHATGGSFYPSSDASSVKVFGSNNSTIACTLGSTNSDEGFFRAYDGGTMKTWVEARGIAFGGDTADANFLNDYEEGTWTPTMHDGTISVDFANYRKIGKQVTVWAMINNFSDRSTNDLLRVKSLPYQPISSTDMLGGAMLGSYCSGSLVHSTYVSSNGQVQFYGTGSGGYEQLRHNELNNSSAQIYFFATYAVG